MTNEEMKKKMAEWREYFGVEGIKKAGLDLFEKEDPEVCKMFIQETEYHMKSKFIPEMWREIIWFASCVACNNRNGAKIHCGGAARAGATREMLIDVIHMASICVHHGLLNVAYDVEPILQEAKK